MICRRLARFDPSSRLRNLTGFADDIYPGKIGQPRPLLAARWRLVIDDDRFHRTHTAD
jgi:hypothetical protein